MSSRSFSKTNMDNYVENILAENLTLKRKLDSKCQALVIISKELSECKSERDQYKLMAEQLQEKCTALKKISLNQNSYYLESEDLAPAVVSDPKELNKSLKFENEDLRQKLRDALGDVKALRSKLNQQKWSTSSESDCASKQLDKEEELVKQLEALNKIKTQLEIDLQSVLDEKEELVTERDAYKCKVHRLNHEFSVFLKGDNHAVIDLDSLIMENRFLQEHLQQAQEENKLAYQTISRYKSMLEKKRSKGSIKLGAENISGMLLTQKQVQELLENGMSDQLPNNPATIADLKSLSIALLESLNDKTLALSHQKRANRILAARICELEQRLEHIRGREIIMSPSKVLLDGYVGFDVDKGVPMKPPEEGSSQISSSEYSKCDESSAQENICSGDTQEKMLPKPLVKLVEKALEEIKLGKDKSGQLKEEKDLKVEVSQEN